MVAEPEGNTVGTLDEDFAVESMAGDVFLLGTTSWRHPPRGNGPGARKTRTAAPTIPFWRGEAPGRTRELSHAMSELREEIAATGVVPEECGLDRLGVEQAVAYAQAGRIALGVMPTDTCVVAERFDEGGGMQLVIHAPLRRTHQPRLGSRAPQAFLPHLQFRAAGGCDR